MLSAAITHFLALTAQLLAATTAQTAQLCPSGWTELRESPLFGRVERVKLVASRQRTPEGFHVATGVPHATLGLSADEDEHGSVEVGGVLLEGGVDLAQEHEGVVTVLALQPLRTWQVLQVEPRRFSTDFAREQITVHLPGLAFLSVTQIHMQHLESEVRENPQNNSKQ
jgi:hypothetical protein